MAKAEKRPKEDFEYVLTLSVEEARTLLTLVGQVSGDVVLSRRRHTADIYDQLRALALNSTGIMLWKKDGRLYFADEPGL